MNCAILPSTAKQCQFTFAAGRNTMSQTGALGMGMGILLQIL